MAYNFLNDEEKKIILYAGTEYAGSGKLLSEKREGMFLCRQCNSPLYTSGQKFESCGWLSFDDSVEKNVLCRDDPDGRRVEIVCAHCLGHLGHVFYGEGFTAKNTRHCVNSLSVNFVPSGDALPQILKE